MNPIQPSLTAKRNGDEEASAIFENLELINKYTNKFHLKDAQCIRPEIVKMSLKGFCTDPKKLPYLILHKIMSNDIRCRTNLYKKILEPRAPKQESNNESQDESESDDDGDSFNPDQLHPVDCLIALLLCCDDLLRRDIFTRLAKCQIAIPLVLPDPFAKKLIIPLWAMRSIYKEWKMIEAKPQQCHHIVSCPMPIVSVVRFGQRQKEGLSKSQILNLLIAGGVDSYSHFFHRDCSGGQYKQVLGEGLIDMSWYLPSDMNSYENAITFLNLHGDAYEFPKQVEFLSQISSVFFVMICDQDICKSKAKNSILKLSSIKPTILNATKISIKDMANIFPNLKIIKVLSKTAPVIDSKMWGHIKSKVAGGNSQEKQNSIVNFVEQTNDSIFSIDERESIHKDSLKHATDIIANINAQKTATKKDILPLQGDLWKSWAKLNKESHRHGCKGDITVDEYAHKMDHDLEIIRSKQRSLSEQMSPVMKSFIHSVFSTMGEENYLLRTYFLQNLILELNKFSTLKLKQKGIEYETAKKEITEKSNIKFKKLLEEEILEHSFGLEHLIRESGQIYEAYFGVKDKYNLCSRLSMAVAQLLVDGYPIELMDGDAAHVPIHWVTAVLQQAIKILGDDYKVYVVSVLGLQSTGKSTMLNTIFGVQFNVSAGRCTRGAFMQLLPFDQELQRLTGCSYVLIVDTEGLRAVDHDLTETERQEHDNELATFVIGLANLTLVNIYGEALGELDDILQTSVHAFLRMNEIEIDSSCCFIYQNASPNTKSEVGRTKFTEKLNIFTKNAAKEENCEGKYKSFNDVIKYDDSTDAHYFSALWKGDPPMAPVNPGYSNTAQSLKLHFINALKNTRSKELPTGLPITSFRVRVSELWESLLKENFVFCFRNTQEISLYTALEVEYMKWNRSMMKSVIEWESAACNQIDLEDRNEVSKLHNKIITELIPEVFEMFYNNAKAEMNKYFEDKKQGIIMKWKHDFEIKLKHQKDSLCQRSQNRLNKIIEARKVLTDFELKKYLIVDEMTLYVQKIINDIKDELKELKRALKNNSLSNSQIQKLSKRKMFTKDKMEIYEKFGVSQDVLEDIEDYISQNQGDKPDSVLSHILCVKLSFDDVNIILKQSSQFKSKEELKEEFEVIWEEFMERVPKFECITLNEIEAKVVTALLEYVGPQGGNAKLNSILKKKPLRHRLEDDFSFQLTDNHFSIPGYMPPVRKFHEKVSKFTHFFYDQKHFMKVEEITKTIFSLVKQYGKKIMERKINFTPELVNELLHYVEEILSTETAKQDFNIQFTNKYKHEVYIRICAFMIPQFSEMAISFAQRYDPRQHLEEFNKKPLFIKYQNQYQQTETEEAVASTLCAYLEEQVKKQVKKLLGSKIESKMSTEGYFSNKRALKVRVLMDLLTKNDFDSYMNYIKDIKKCLHDHIEKYIIAYCDRKAEKREYTELQEAAFDLVIQIIEKIKTIVLQPLPDDITLEEWLSSICKDSDFSKIGVKLSSKDIICDYDSFNLDRNNFLKIVSNYILELTEKVSDSFITCEAKSEIQHWDIKPDEMFEDLIGCTAQCPFCGEQCDHLHHTESEAKHYAEVHQQDCLDGWRDRLTQVMNPNVCNILVAGDGHFFRRSDKRRFKFKDYLDAYPNWYIPQSKTTKSTLYWKRFTVKHESQLLEYYGAKSMKYPNSWKLIDDEAVKRDLHRVYKLN